MARIILNAIVRNEAARIDRCLASALPFVHAVVILDTGSTDDTKRRIETAASLLSVPCVVKDGEFRNFSQARNDALELGRQFAETFGPDCYFLLMDADMELVAEPGAFDNLTAPAYALIQKAGIAYRNTRLVRADVPAVYRGSTHEYLSVEGCINLDTAHFIDHADGANRPGKMERDVALLKAELAETPDDPRALFYLANTYADMGLPGIAATIYDQRVAVGGWPEEQWMAQLKAGRCHIAAGREAEGVHRLLSAHQMRPWRAEALYSLAEHYRAKGEFHAALPFAQAARKIYYPYSDSLFIEDYVYQVGARFEFSVAAFYANDWEAREDGCDEAQRLVVTRGAPEITRYNLAFWAKPLDKHAPSFKSWRLPWTPPEGWSASNPGMARIGDTIFINIRSGNYHLHDDGSFTAPPGESVKTRNYLCALMGQPVGDLITLTEVKEIAEPADWPEPLSTRIRGFEDLRIVQSSRNTLLFSATHYERTPEGWCEIATGEIENDDHGQPRMVNVHITAPDGPKANEKNWAFVDDMSGRFIYKADPTRLVDNQGHTISERPAVMALDHLRGGSPLLPFDGGFLCATHEVCFTGGALRKYLHRWVWFDAELNIRKVSHAFTITGQPYEAILGLVWSPWESETLLFSYGRWDREAFLGSISADDIRASLVLS